MAMVRLTIKSSNRKVGPIPVSTTEASTCPDACPLKAGGCYAKGGPLAIVWNNVRKQGTNWAEFCDKIKGLPEGQLWRHNQAGDLPGDNDTIDADKMDSLVNANIGRKGFTYTHKPLNAENLAIIRKANQKGFTVNISCNSLADLDDKMGQYSDLPMTTLLDQELHGHGGTIITEAGNKVAVCPATYKDDVSCMTCGLCQRTDRKVAVGFPAHGYAKAKASKIANE